MDDEGEFDDLCEQAITLGLLDDNACDALTDAIASCTITEAAAIQQLTQSIATRSQLPARDATRQAALPVPPALQLPRTPESIAVILDTHYLRVAMKAFSVRSGWSVEAFEAALVGACGGAPGSSALRMRFVRRHGRADVGGGQLHRIAA